MVILSFKSFEQLLVINTKNTKVEKEDGSVPV